MFDARRSPSLATPGPAVHPVARFAESGLPAGDISNNGSLRSTPSAHSMTCGSAPPHSALELRRRRRDHGYWRQGHRA
eukprot:83406-Pyramimonas_sp.AAC.1